MFKTKETVLELLPKGFEDRVVKVVWPVTRIILIDAGNADFSQKNGTIDRMVGILEVKIPGQQRPLAIGASPEKVILRGVVKRTAPSAQRQISQRCLHVEVLFKPGANGRDVWIWLGG